MQRATQTKVKILALLKDRSEECLAKIYQFIRDLDELEDIEFLYPVNHAFAEELNERAAEAAEMLETTREIEGTLRDLRRGRIKIQ